MGLLGTAPAVAQPAEPTGAPPAGQADQQAPAAPADETPPPPPPPPAEQAPAGEQTPPADPAAPADGSRTVEDRLSDLEGKLEGISEPFSAMQSDVTTLKRIKFSGYLQGRYEWRDNADFGQTWVAPRVDRTSSTTENRGLNRFYVRRARLKTTYVGDLSEFVLQIDATGDGVVLRDAEASFHLTNENPWMPSATPWDLKLTMGQFKIPFGFEVLQSSGDREFTERSAVMGALYAGERDRGLRLQYIMDFFRFSAAVINGAPIGSNDPHGTFEQSSWKDVVGRIGGDFDWLNFGLSGHVGRFLRRTREATMANPIAGYDRYSRLRLGSDAQLFFDIPGLGGLQLRGEVIYSKDEQMAFSGVEPGAARCNDRGGLGWYAAIIQNLGDHLTLAARYDQWDPTQSLPSSCQDGMTSMPLTASQRDRVDQLSLALLGHISGNLKATLEYDHLIEHELSQRDNDIVTVQLQAKF